MAQLCISFNELANNAANLVSLLFTMCLTFCGVLVSSDAMPRFWIFMYRCNPFTYLVSSILSLGLADSDVTCSDKELLKFKPQTGRTCGEYMQPYIEKTGGYLISNDSTESCNFCTTSSTNVFLSNVGADYSTKSRDIGIFVCFIVINIMGTIFLYWIARVPKGSRQKISK